MGKVILANTLDLIYPPTSARDFAYIKKDDEMQHCLANSKLYLIVQRPEITFENVYIDNTNITFDLVQKSTSHKINTCVFCFRNEMILQKYINEEIDIDICWNIEEPNRKAPYNNVAGFKFSYSDKFLFWISPERLIYLYLRDKVQVDGFENVKMFNQFYVHYVGKATDQDIWKRLTGHEKLQDILSKEIPISYESLPANEIIILFFSLSEAKSSTIISGKEIDSLSVPELEKTILDSSRIPATNKIMLDAEKAFVHILNPKYNEVKFEKYPFSKDGLYNENFTAYSFKIKYEMELRYKNNSILGSSDDLYSDIIIILNNKHLFLHKKIER